MRTVRLWLTLDGDSSPESLARLELSPHLAIICEGRTREKEGGEKRGGMLAGLAGGFQTAPDNPLPDCALH